MAEQPEMIQQELDETRHALAEKLGQIGEKISGTVETVTDTVSNVTETVSNVTEAVEGTVQNVAQAVSGTVESVKDTVENVGETAANAVESVKHAFNLSEQVQNHPWICFGGSVVLGFIGGKLLAPRGARTPEADSFVRGRGYYERDKETQGTYASTGNGSGRDRGPSRDAEEAGKSGATPSWLSSLYQRFGPEIDKLKGLAVGTLFGVTRDMVSQALPETLKDQVTHLFNDFTEKAGGSPIQGTVLQESSSGDANQGAGTFHGAEHEQSRSTEMDRPVGTAQGKGQAAVGRPHR